MERPSSSTENQHPSGLKPPSRLPAAISNSATRSLLETSQSSLNVRNGGAAGGLMGPPLATYKHKITGHPEPQPPSKQRKTLAERAAEPLATLRSHIPAKSIFARSESSFAQLGSRSTGGVASTYRPNVSASTASSIGSIRPLSRQRYVGHRPASIIETVPMPAEEEMESATADNPKGTPILSSNTITVRKPRAKGNLRQHHQSASTSTRSQHSGSGMRNGVVCESSESEQSSRSTSLSSTRTLSQQEPKGHVPRNPSFISALNNFHISQADHAQSRPSSWTRHRSSLESIKEVVSPSKIPNFSCTPALRLAPSLQALSTPTPLRHKSINNGLHTPLTTARRRPRPPVFLTKEMLTPMPAWDTQRRLDDFDKLFSQMASQINSNTGLQESLDLHKIRVRDLQETNTNLTAMNSNLTLSTRALTTDVERVRIDLHATTSDLRQAYRDHERDMAEMDRRHEKSLSDAISKHEKEIMRLQMDRERDSGRFTRDMDEAKEKWRKEKDYETADLTTQHWEEMDQLKIDHEREKAILQAQVDELRQSGESRATETAGEVQTLREGVASLQNQLEAANATTTSLRARVASEQIRNSALEQEKSGLVSKTHFLEGNQEAQSLEFTTMRDQLQEAITSRDSTLETLRQEEMIRRKLNATILELKGNIRVFVRTRPLLSGEDDPAKVDYPDAESLDGGKEMIVHAPTTLSAAGKERNEKHNYSFDRAFGPGTANAQVFQDCRDLIQSVVDGYNVSILSYGQTGSGKTYGMSGPDGIIPSAIGLLLSEMQRLSVKGWDYVVDASFVEVYNETLNDLLGDAKTWDEANDMNAGKRKETHEIRHDAITGKTTVTNMSCVTLWPPPENDGQWPPSAPINHEHDQGDEAATYTERAVHSLLETAAKNRRVAATKANERSSRSHSIFMLTLRGRCEATGETSEGILNLVDLAGSERLKQSGAEGNRMKETQAINKSLSSLGDVIAALGNKSSNESHIPYRNSKLTYLLQSSLGGTAANGKSSRTLMLLHLSPLQQHWQESKSSLLFGSKVHGTHIGTAKKR